MLHRVLSGAAAALLAVALARQFRMPAVRVPAVRVPAVRVPITGPGLGAGIGVGVLLVIVRPHPVRRH